MYFPQLYILYILYIVKQYTYIYIYLIYIYIHISIFIPFLYTSIYIDRYHIGILWLPHFPIPQTGRTQRGRQRPDHGFREAAVQGRGARQEMQPQRVKK